MVSAVALDAGAERHTSEVRIIPASYDCCPPDQHHN